MTAPTRRAYFAAALVVFGWSLTGVLVKDVSAIGYGNVVFLRIAIALAVLLTYFSWTGALWTEIRGLMRSGPSLILGALLGAYYVFSTLAFQTSLVAETSLLLGTAPLFSLAYGLLERRWPTRRQLLSVCTALAGLTLALAPIEAEAPESSGTGRLKALAAAASMAAYAVAYRRMSARGLPISTSTVFLATLAVGLIATAPLVDPALFSARVTTQNLSALVLLAVLSTFVPSVCMAIAARTLPAVVVATINVPVPIFAAMIAYAYLGEELPPLFTPGGLIALLGVYALVSSHIAVR